MDDLKGKVALITGASSGIGAAAALAFGSRGTLVAVHYNSREREAQGVAAAIRKAGADAAVFQADVSSSGALARLAGEVHARFGRIDILVNNAGGFVQRVLLAEASDELIDRVFHQNARSMIALGRHVIPHMRRQKSGTIINVTSQAARTGGSQGSGLYSASKAYISTYTRTLAKELVGDGIRVNAVAPGIIDTPIHEGHTSPELLAQLCAGIPMRRLGRADECAGALLFLASEKLASYITGQIIEINGGLLMP
jgi:3-oxoacyl-[acyl-carrier protein] reductase